MPRQTGVRCAKVRIPTLDVGATRRARARERETEVADLPRRAVGTTAASVLQAGMGAEFSPQVGGEGTPRSQGSGHSGSRRGSYPLAAREGSSDEITASDLAALALEATESKSKACTLQ